MVWFRLPEYSTRALVALLLLGSCTWVDVDYSIEPDLQPYAEAFYNEASAHGVRLTKENLVIMTRVGLKDEGMWGVSRKEGRQRIIYIDAEYYNDMVRGNHQDRVEFLVFHEMGHALLGRHHTADQSIMNPGWHDFHNHRTEFLDELFYNR